MTNFFVTKSTFSCSVLWLYIKLWLSLGVYERCHVQPLWIKHTFDVYDHQWKKLLWRFLNVDGNPLKWIVKKKNKKNRSFWFAVISWTKPLTGLVREKGSSLWLSHWATQIKPMIHIPPSYTQLSSRKSPACTKKTQRLNEGCC